MMAELTEQELMDISSQIGANDWKKVGLILQFSWTELIRFQCDNRDSGLTAIVFCMLFQWQRKLKETQKVCTLTNLKLFVEHACQEALQNTSVSQLVAGSLQDDLFLYRVAEHVGKKWQELGCHLGLSEGVLEHVKIDNSQNSADAAMEALVKWRNINAHKPECFSKLLRNLKKVGLTDLANTLGQFQRQQIKPDDLQFNKDESGHDIFLGSGAFGKVLLATYIPILEPVAVKILHSGTPLPPNIQRMLLKEVKNMLEIHSSHTVSLYGMLMDSENYCYAVIMELMANGCLRDVLEKLVLPCGIKTKIAMDMCQGISYIHAKGMVHGDIKAGNVLLDSSFRGRLSDFGQARFVQSMSTHSRIRTGTPTHSAPEMIHPDLPKGFAADLWSCGITFFELFAEKRRSVDELFKRLPFNEGTSAEVMICMLIALKKSPISPEQINAKLANDCPEVFVSLMQKTTAINPEDRPQPSQVLKELKLYFTQFHVSNYKEELDQMAQSLGTELPSDILVESDGSSVSEEQTEGPGAYVYCIHLFRFSKCSLVNIVTFIMNKVMFSTIRCKYKFSISLTNTYMFCLFLLKFVKFNFSEMETEEQAAGMNLWFNLLEPITK